jgi:hypothetical protein
MKEVRPWIADPASIQSATIYNTTPSLRICSPHLQWIENILFWQRGEEDYLVRSIQRHRNVYDIFGCHEQALVCNIAFVMIRNDNAIRCHGSVLDGNATFVVVVGHDVAVRSHRWVLSWNFAFIYRNDPHANEFTVLQSKLFVGTRLSWDGNHEAFGKRTRIFIGIGIATTWMMKAINAQIAVV